MADYREYTPEEILELVDLNENYDGTCANLSKVALYHSIRNDLIGLMKENSDIRMVEGYAPNIGEKHAMIWIDLSPAATLNKRNTAVLTEIMNKADGTVFSAIDGHVRISFDVNDIWED